MYSETIVIINIVVSYYFGKFIVLVYVCFDFENAIITNYKNINNVIESLIPFCKYL